MVAAKASGLSVNQIRYAVKKAEDSSFHANSHSGARNVRYTPEERALLHQEIWEVINNNPRFQLCEIVEAVSVDVNIQYVHKV